MALSAVKNWFARHTSSHALAPELAWSLAPLPTVDLAPLLTTPGPPPTWTPDRLVTTDALWGDGYQLPGGEIETLRLAKPLGLSAASSLLLLGAGTGGAACSVSAKLGAWVSGFEADTSLAAAATDRVARLNLTRRVQIETWNPVEPVFRKHFYHHGMA